MQFNINVYYIFFVKKNTIKKPKVSLTSVVLIIFMVFVLSWPEDVTLDITTQKKYISNFKLVKKNVNPI